MVAELKIKKRHAIKKSQLNTLKSKLTESIGIENSDLFKSNMIEIAETVSEFNLYIINKVVMIMETEEWAFPTLRGVLSHPISGHKIVVDMGAVPYVVNGADIMRPGVVSVSDDVIENHPALIVDERNGSPLSISIPLYNADKIMALNSGKIAKNVHFIGDDLWNLDI
ncbi:MAG TPA: RNA-binding protein [Methanocorpusculum sp.]|nr:RNA-binding protein [Methanocorpusculum sp.]HJJ56312.1 RNA-binding protein [Methanocorpusculum sp.]